MARQPSHDDHYQRAEESDPINRLDVPSPWDYNPNPGADLPMWRQYGFESEEAYQVAMHEARIQEQLAAYRQGRPIPQNEAPAGAGAGLMQRFFGNDQQQNPGDENQRRVD